MIDTISRDKKNPNWAMVWDQPDEKYKRIIIDVFNDGICRCVVEGDEYDYEEGIFYYTMLWHHYEIIKPKTWRAFKDIEEFKAEYVKRDPRINHTRWDSIRTITKASNDYVRLGDQCITVQELFDEFTWLDGSTIGVEE